MPEDSIMDMQYGNKKILAQYKKLGSNLAKVEAAVNKAIALAQKVEKI